MGSLFTAFGQIQEGRAAEKQGSFAKEIAIRNQQSLERQAVAEEQASEIETARIARQEKIVTGRQIVAGGKSGGQIAGATLSLLTDAARQFSIEKNLALRTGLIRGQQLREQGRIIAAGGRFAKSFGAFQKRLSFIKATGTVLGGASEGEFGPSVQRKVTFQRTTT